MNVFRRVLALMLVLTQAATTFAGPGVTVCISPKGHVCLDALFGPCMCCESGTPIAEPVGIQVDDEIGDQCNSLCSCHPHDSPASPSLSPVPNGVTPKAAMWQGQPCRCTHTPLIETRDATEVQAYRSVSDERTSLDLELGVPGLVVAILDCSSTDSVAFLPSRPPSGHLLAVACAVLRC